MEVNAICRSQPTPQVYRTVKLTDILTYERPTTCHGIGQATL